MCSHWYSAMGDRSVTVGQSVGIPCVPIGTVGWESIGTVGWDG